MGAVERMHLQEFRVRCLQEAQAGGLKWKAFSAELSAESVALDIQVARSVSLHCDWL